MQIELRADGAHISGYVNVTEKKSRPVITPHGRVIEEIEPRAFERAINRAGNITLTLDHDCTHIYANTEDGSLKLYEDSIGLHADVLIRDANIIDLAKRGAIKGWSFGMYNVQDTVEERAEGEPVSYTHLDVYKRQAWRLRMRFKNTTLQDIRRWVLWMSAQLSCLQSGALTCETKVYHSRGKARCAQWAASCLVGCTVPLG